MGHISKTYYPTFDGLRALAILAVFLYHINPDFFSFGWIGVNLFFVLSGFLISTIILDSINHPNFFRNFYIRRSLRIFPLYYLIIILFLIVLPLFLSQSLQDSLIDIRIWYLFYVQNIYHGLNGWTHPGYLNHLWTLAIEEQFYMLWPVTLFLMRSKFVIQIRTTALLIAIAILLRLFLQLQGINDIFIQTFTFTRMDSLLIGALIAMMVNSKSSNNLVFLDKLTWAAPIFFLLFLLCVKYDEFNFLSETALSISFGLVIYYCFKSDQKNRNNWFINALRLKTIRKLGIWSYGFYVYHYIVILMLRPKLETFFASWNDPFSTFIKTFILFLISVIISFLSYNYFEKKFLTLKNRFN